jgi:hypothetical protein
MLRIAFAAMGFALAGSASAGWRDMQVDARSETAFKESVQRMREEMPRAHGDVFAWALQRIWLAGATRAKAEGREFAAGEYFHQLDGLRYRAVRETADPNGKEVRAVYVASLSQSSNNKFATPYFQAMSSAGFSTFAAGGGPELKAQQLQCNCPFPH